MKAFGWKWAVAMVFSMGALACSSEDPTQTDRDAGVIEDIGGAEEVGGEDIGGDDAGGEDTGGDDTGVDDTGTGEPDAEPDVDICEPATCEELERSCGSWPDQCQGMVECGSCDEGTCDEGICVELNQDAPVAAIDGAPDAQTAQTSATFEFSCDQSECEFECSLDGEVEPCTSPMDYDELEDGMHIFRVRARLGEDLVGPWAEHSWTINTAAPTLVFDMTPPGETEEQDATFEFSCEDDLCVEFECALDTEEGDGEFESCQSPYPLEDLSPGIYIFNVRGTDEVGNQASISHIWEVLAPGWAYLAPSLRRSCGITAEQELYCWSDAVDESLLPVKVDDHLWNFVATGTSHRCGIRDDDSLWCWGGNSYGQLGVGTEDTSTIPLAVAPGSSWSHVSAGYFHTCGLRTDGTAWCWGYGNSGLLGSGNDNSNIPLQVGTDDDWITISARGEAHSCGIREGGSLWCWGNNSFGQIGDGTTDVPDGPVQIGEDHSWVDVTAELTHTCALNEEGQVYCWGDNNDGSLGTGNFEDQWSPTPVAGGHTFVSLIGSEHVSCGMTEDNEIWCWGLNNMGQLARGEHDGQMVGGQTGENSAVPVQITVEGVSWQELYFGSVVGCAKDSSNNLWCWGNNDYGAFGNGESGYRSTVPIPAAEVPAD